MVKIQTCINQNRHKLNKQSWYRKGLFLFFRLCYNWRKVDIVDKLMFFHLYPQVIYTYLLHDLTCVVPVSKGCTTPMSRPLRLLGWIALCHAFLFWTNNVSKPLTARFFFIHCNHVFLGQPLRLLPVTIVLSTFLGHVSGSICWTWPHQRRRPCLRAFSMEPKPNRLLSSSDGTLSLSFVEHIHLIIIISLWLRRGTSSCVAAHVSLAYNKTLRTHVL